MIKKLFFALAISSSVAFATPKFEVISEDEVAYRLQMLELLANINRNITYIRDDISKQKVLLDKLIEMNLIVNDANEAFLSSTMPSHHIQR